MLILKPISVETIWGSNRLYDYCGDVTKTKIGSLYTVAAQEDLSNLILNGEFKDNSLYKVFQLQPNLFNFNRYQVFPLLIGLVDACDNLSIQVHPTDEYAKKIEGKPFGKTESWVFIEPPKSGSIFDGIKCSTIDEVKENIANDNFMNIIDSLEVKQGDYVYVEAGTIHALTEGSLVYEIQQSTDITYRFYDYDRLDKEGNKRELQLEKALAVIDTNKKSVSKHYFDNANYEEKYYTTRVSQVSGNYHNKQDVFVSVTVIEGQLEYDNILIRKGMSFIVFPNEKIELAGNAKCITAIPR